MAKHSDYRPDRFDTLTDSNRVGVHRTKPKIGSTKVTVLFAFLATLLLTTLGVILIQLQPESIKYSDDSTSGGSQTAATTSIKPVLDPAAEVVVLNGTEIDDLSFYVDDEITDNEWGTVVFSGDADESDTTISAVFYGSEEHAAAATALAQQLGGMTAYLNPDYMTLGGDLTILLGSDYRGPGYDAAINQEHPRKTESVSLSPGYTTDDESFEEIVYVEGGYYKDGIFYEGEYMAESPVENTVTWQ